jgi:glutathione S-transferase
MIQAMDTPPEAAPESRAKLEAELDWLDETLSDGGGFLVGERFSRVDLTVAALLAPFARPEQAEVYRAVTLPPPLQRDVERWRNRPSMTWVRRIYQQYRLPG